MATFQERKQDFWEWHKANPRVWEYFERFSLEVVNKGHQKVSHWLIINRIRWEVYLETTGEDFKISNDFIAYYARLFMHNHPQYLGFFKTKALKR